ncbi:MAG: RbsD/FucU family protein [Planctomycetota bacterium]
MLKNIPPILGPQLLEILMSMGHGDELVIADGNFPAETCAERLVRADGHDVPPLLEAILQFFPLDQYAEKPVALMQVVPGDDTVPTIWDEYRRIIDASQDGPVAIEEVERFAFYDRAREAFAVVATSEKALYANIILKKGVC